MYVITLFMYVKKHNKIIRKNNNKQNSVLFFIVDFNEWPYILSELKTAYKIFNDSLASLNKIYINTPLYTHLISWCCNLIPLVEGMFFGRGVGGGWGVLHVYIKAKDVCH